MSEKENSIEIIQWLSRSLDLSKFEDAIQNAQTVEEVNEILELVYEVVSAKDDLDTIFFFWH